MDLTVLIVDDEMIIQKLIAAALRKMFARTITVSSAKQGLQILETTDVHLITLDLMMPEISGSEMLGLLKNDPRWSMIPVIVISAAGQGYEIEEVRRLGAAEVISKPFSLSELESTVHSLLGGQIDNP